MTCKNSNQPFGIIFEEVSSPDMNGVEYYYDNELDISIYIDKFGKAIPCVEFQYLNGTQTITRKDNEGFDSDDTNMQRCFETQTLTFVAKDKHDDDENEYLSFWSSLDTMTATKIDKENCDEDE